MSSFLRILAILIFASTALVASFQYSAGSWPQTEGLVVEGRWARENELAKHDKGSYVVEYDYTTPDGVARRGDNVSFSTANGTAVVIQSDRDKVERQPREGDKVTVHYFPLWKDYSILRTAPAPTLPVWLIGSVLISVTLLIYSRIMNQPVI
jgi:hypothetical protein